MTIAIVVATIAIEAMLLAAQLYAHRRGTQ